MSAPAPYATRWEREQHAADNGALAAIAQGYKDLGDYLAWHGQQDRKILGIDRLAPEPLPYLLPVPGGTAEEQVAAVNAFADAHGVTPHWDDSKYTWRAVLWFGPVRYVAYYIPSEAGTKPAPVAAPELAGREA